MENVNQALKNSEKKEFYTLKDIHDIMVGYIDENSLDKHVFKLGNLMLDPLLVALIGADSKYDQSEISKERVFKSMR